MKFNMLHNTKRIPSPLLDRCKKKISIRNINILLFNYEIIEQYTDLKAHQNIIGIDSSDNVIWIINNYQNALGWSESWDSFVNIYIKNGTVYALTFGGITYEVNIETGACTYKSTSIN